MPQKALLHEGEEVVGGNVDVRKPAFDDEMASRNGKDGGAAAAADAAANAAADPAAAVSEVATVLVEATEIIAAMMSTSRCQIPPRLNK